MNVARLTALKLPKNSVDAIAPATGERNHRSARRASRPLVVLSTVPLGSDVEAALRSDGWIPICATGKKEAQRLYRETGFRVGLAFLATNFGKGWLNDCRSTMETLPGIEWIGVLSQDQIEDEDIQWFIVETLREFLLQPVEPPHLSFALDQALRMAEIQQALRGETDVDATDHFGLVGDSPVMMDLYRQIQRAGVADIPVLIAGDTGTGKELVARAIHALSPRAAGPFVALNCAAIPRDLLLSELFGHEEGAFTGAYQRTTGRIEAANGGTLLLDEVGGMPLESQASLLRVLEEKRVTLIGGSKTSRIDVRFLATTNRDLEPETGSNGFRADLYYRLAAMKIRVPTLNERTGDIEALAYHFLAQAREKVRRRILDFGGGVLDALCRHSWPGNVRELKNCILQAASTCSGRLIKPSDLQLGTALAPRSVPESLQHAVHEAESEALLSALIKNYWNVSQSARDLEISRMTMYRLMDKHGISKKDDAPRMGYLGLGRAAR